MTHHWLIFTIKMEIMKQLFNKYFRLYKKHSKNDEYKVGLIKVMMSMDHLDTAQELVWQLGKKIKNQPIIEVC